MYTRKYTTHKYTTIDKLTAYGILGGIPRYLNAFSKEDTIQENIEKEIVANGAFLNDELIMLLRMELREPSEQYYGGNRQRI